MQARHGYGFGFVEVVQHIAGPVGVLVQSRHFGDVLPADVHNHGRAIRNTFNIEGMRSSQHTSRHREYGIPRIVALQGDRSVGFLGSAVGSEFGQISGQAAQARKSSLKVDWIILPPFTVTDIGVIEAADGQGSAVNGITVKNLPMIIINVSPHNEYIRTIGRCIQLVAHAEAAESGVSAGRQPAFRIGGLVNVPQQEYIEILGNTQRF
ncbi:hypothetical protein D3C75_818590 [compost metagenome]